MGFLDKLKFQAWDSVGFVVKHLREWQPSGCSTEKQYENSLYKYLHDCLPEIQVTRQHAQGRIHADLVIGGKVIVELKHNLNTTAKYQRLIGQVTEYKNWDGRVVILLTGMTDPYLRKELRQFLKRERLGEDDWEIVEAKVTVFEK